MANLAAAVGCLQAAQTFQSKLLAISAASVAGHEWDWSWDCWHFDVHVVQLCALLLGIATWTDQAVARLVNVTDLATACIAPLHFTYYCIAIIPNWLCIGYIARNGLVKKHTRVHGLPAALSVWACFLALLFLFHSKTSTSVTCGSLDAHALVKCPAIPLLQNVEILAPVIYRILPVCSALGGCVHYSVISGPSVEKVLHCV